MDNIVIGENVTIEDGVVLKPFGGVITIMDNVTIERDVMIYGGGNVQIKSNTIICPRVQIYAQNYGTYKDEIIRKQKKTGYGIWIDQDCLIGAGSIILDACRIEKGVVVEPGSVVTTHIAIGYSIWSGNPARIKGMRRVYQPMKFASEEVSFPETLPYAGGKCITPVKYPEEIKSRF